MRGVYQLYATVLYCFGRVYTRKVACSNHALPTTNKRGRSSVWLERLPVTQEVASSNLVGPANLFNSLRIAVLIYLLHCSDFCSDPVTSLDSFNDSVQSKLFQLSCR